MTDNSSIWKIDSKNAWSLYTHTDYKQPEVKSSSEKEEKKENTKTKTQSTAFSFTKTKPLTKGGMVCTPHGYGIIQSINEDRATITVKVEGQTHELPEKEVLNEIPINIVFMNGSLKREEVMYLPINSTMTEVIEKIENSSAEGDNNYAVSLFLKGKEIMPTSDTVEKIKMMPFSNFLGIVKPKKPHCVKRYPMDMTGWSIGFGNMIGISFSPSKTIRVIGFAVYRPSQGTLSYTASYFNGSNSKITAPVWQKEMSSNETPEKHEYDKVMFNKPILLKAGEYGSVVMTITSHNHVMCHYGNGGKPVVEGERDVSFNFKVLEDVPFLAGVDSGQIPEIYYYV